MIFVLKKVVHAQSEIFQAEFPEVFACNREGIEIVLFQIPAKLAALFLVLTPQKAYCQKGHRDNDRRDDVNTQFTLQSLDHVTNIFCAAVANRPAPVPPETRSVEDGSQHPGQALCRRQGCLTDHRFPVRLDNVLFSHATSVGRESAYATALATSCGLIIFSRGHLPSIWVQMSVSVAAG